MWHDHAQLVVAGSAGTVADPDIISVRDAFSILLSHPEIFNGYLPGELQEAFLTILGRDSAQQIALHAQSFLHRNPHSAQRAAQPLPLMPVRDAGAPLRAVSVSAGDAGNGSATGIASSAQLGADSTRPGRGQRRPASPAGRPQRRRVETPLAAEDTHRRRVSAPRRPSAPPLDHVSRRAASQPAAARPSIPARPSAEQQALLPPANAAEQPASPSLTAQPAAAQPAAAQTAAAQTASAQPAVPVPASEQPAERATVGAALASEARATVGAALAS